MEYVAGASVVVKPPEPRQASDAETKNTLYLTTSCRRCHGFVYLCVMYFVHFGSSKSQTKVHHPLNPSWQRLIEAVASFCIALPARIAPLQRFDNSDGGCTRAKAARSRSRWAETQQPLRLDRARPTPGKGGAARAVAHAHALNIGRTR